MRTTNVMLSAICVASVLSDGPLMAVDPSSGAARRSASAPQSAPLFRLPRDPQTPVITMAFTDPRSAGPPTVPELSIFADGRVAATTEASSHRVVTAQLPQQEWQKVQRELFVVNDLLSCRTEDLQDAIVSLRWQRRRPQPGPEAAVTIFTIRGEGIAHEVRCHAVGLTATQLPDLPDIQRLYACQRCLQNIVHVVRAGGYDQVNRTLQAVNTRLERQLPGCGPLCSHDLHLVDSRPDGTRYLQFSRLPSSQVDLRGQTGGLQRDEPFLMVSVYERPGRPPEISIVGDSAAQ